MHKFKNSKMKRTRLVDLSRSGKKSRRSDVVVVKRAPLRRAFTNESKPELKELTVYAQPYMAISGTPGSYVGSLVNMATGTDITNRIGRHIRCKTFQTDIVVYPPTSFSGTAQLGGVGDEGFIALVYDSSPDGSAATFAAIFDTASALNPGQSFKNTLQFRDRFHICWIEQIAIVSGYSAAASVGEPGYWQGNCRKFRKFYVVPAWMKTEYNASTSGVPNTGAFYIVAASVNATGVATDMFSFGYNNKLTFTDT